MIDQSAMLQAMVEKCPAFTPVYESFISDWSDEHDRPLYLLLADFARFLVTLLESDNHEVMNAAFELIETLLTDGDSFVRTAVTVGILENIQNANIHRTTTPQQFVELLGPMSSDHWRKLSEFWSGTDPSEICMSTEI